MPFIRILYIIIFFGVFHEIIGQDVVNVKIDIRAKSLTIEVMENGRDVSEFYTENLNKLDSLGNEFIEFWNDFYSEKTHLFLYAHSLYGATFLYKDITRTTIQSSILDSTPMPLFIVNWGSWNPLYGKNKDIALQKGKMLASLLQPFLNSGYTIHSLHHSMGARVLEGMLPEFKEGQIIDQVFFVAPDLDSTFLQRDSNLIAKHIRELHIFYSPNDLVLGLAELINQKKRLGNMKKAKQLNHIHLYDTRELECLLNNNHLNWLTCSDIRDIISDQLHQVYFEK